MAGASNIPVAAAAAPIRKPPGKEFPLGVLVVVARLSFWPSELNGG
jgi:hypothetical protein